MARDEEKVEASQPKPVFATAVDAFLTNFLGDAPQWFTGAVIACLIINPILLAQAGPFVAGWAIIVEFIACLAMALKCYPLQSGGLIAFEAVLLGLTNPNTVYHEVHSNFPVIMLLMFMVAAIHFEREFLMFAFTKIMVKIKHKGRLSLTFCFMGAVLSAFLDALTVTAVVITVATGFYAIFHRVANGLSHDNTDHDHEEDGSLSEKAALDLNNFRGFLRNLMMHTSVGTALGGVMTLVGEPQNLIVGETMGWHFGEFFMRMLPVTAPVFVCGLATCLFVEWKGVMGYGVKMPESVREVLERAERFQGKSRTPTVYSRLVVQGIGAILLICALAFHVAEVGLIGLGLLVILTAVNGVIKEGQIGHAFEEALPFTALLCVFFTVIGVIHDQHLFAPIIHLVLGFEGKGQLEAFYWANGSLSAISDNVFVAGTYISEAKKAFDEGLITRDQFEKIAVAINVGTNIPSVATPNGQAAFLFLLTSGLAPLIKLGYGQMVKLALPYTVVLSVVGWLGVKFLL
ncbi:sodium/proton antiporter NhaB [Candidatus Peregrinibacteria bacterium CG10_big_fil_rev_8_21_14_0_10_36_19]|nr:MAG: sodium/proton antiporter NhaB [Candidatus Peregrinibacteria bacterium CG10_big_fil_rev_8_21_14_0_10_36_19]